MPPVSVQDFTSADGPAFKALNLAWIEPLFSVEPSDLAQLDDPQTNIIDKGGRVLIAHIDGEPVGTVGLIAGATPGSLELVKMSARSDLRGQGIGKALLAAAIAAAKEMNAKQIWLESNSKLVEALGIYRAHGFRELACGEYHPTPYSRCDVQMVLTL